MTRLVYSHKIDLNDQAKASRVGSTISNVSLSWYDDRLTFEVMNEFNNGRISLPFCHFTGVIQGIPAGGNSGLVLVEKIQNASKDFKLTLMQMETLDLICSGMNNVQMMEYLGINIRAITGRVQALKKALKASTRCQVCAKAVYLGIVQIYF